jgi:predicted naringenin-chalcone synthase
MLIGRMQHPIASAARPLAAAAYTPAGEPRILASSYLNRIAAVAPRHDVHAAFVDFAENMLEDQRNRQLFRRMAGKAAIDHRFSCLRMDLPGDDGVMGQVPGGEVTAAEFYEREAFPSTGARMHVYERAAPVLLRETLDCLRLSPVERDRIRHVIVTSCTGLYAPGLDFEVIDHLRLAPSTERTMIGFMGCYAAINALKQARHIVRSEPDESVLVVNLELCTLHFKETQDLGEVLSYLVFADGCAASLVSSNPVGFSLDGFRAVQVPNTRDLITWNIRGQGFDMQLSGRVPHEISQVLAEHAALIVGKKNEIDLWAVHPGGRSVLDAVAQALKLSPSAMAASRDVLARFGNMSSATVMFVLRELMAAARPGQQGCAMAFGPGLTAETMRFHAV